MKRPLLAVIAAIAVCVTLISPLRFAPGIVGVRADEPGVIQGEARYAKKKINLFKKKSTSSAKLCAIPKGNEMTLLEISGNWGLVVYTDEDGNFYEGYVKRANISKNPVIPTPTPDPTPTPEPSESPMPSPTMPFIPPIKPGGGGAGPTASPSITDILGITPGKAYTKGHKSGNYKALAYGAVGLKLPSEPVSELTLDNKLVDITLTSNGERKAFTAGLISNGEAIYMTLEPAEYSADALWHIGGGALNTFDLSGVTGIILDLDENTDAVVSARDLFSGVGYDALRASGTPVSGIGLEIELSGGGCGVWAATPSGRRQLPDHDDKVFYARGLTILDEKSLADFLAINAEG